LNRRGRNGLKRMGVLALAMVIALGALGVAYAAWTDSVTVEGTVETGTLDIDITGVSSTFVYKVEGADEPDLPPDTVVHYVYASTDTAPPDGGTLIASAVTVPDNAPDSDLAYMTFTGLFPGVDFVADLELEYVGNIPAKVSLAEIYATDDPAGALAALWQRGKDTKGDTTRYGAWLDGELSTDDGVSWTYIDDPLGLQLHESDLVHITLNINLPQEEQFKNLNNLGFTGIVTIIQWNEYEE